jgi:hypothetical protein
MEGFTVYVSFLVKLDLVMLFPLKWFNKLVKIFIGYAPIFHIFPVELIIIYCTSMIKCTAKIWVKKNFTFGLSVAEGPKFGRRTQKRGRLEM